MLRNIEQMDQRLIIQLYCDSKEAELSRAILHSDKAIREGHHGQIGGDL
jgi:hypothetical protein